MKKTLLVLTLASTILPASSALELYKDETFSLGLRNVITLSTAPTKTKTTSDNTDQVTRSSSRSLGIAGRFMLTGSINAPHQIQIGGLLRSDISTSQADKYTKTYGSNKSYVITRDSKDSRQFSLPSKASLTRANAFIAQPKFGKFTYGYNWSIVSGYAVPTTKVGNSPISGDGFVSRIGTVFIYNSPEFSGVKLNLSYGQANSNQYPLVTGKIKDTFITNYAWQTQYNYLGTDFSFTNVYEQRDKNANISRFAKAFQLSAMNKSILPKTTSSLAITMVLDDAYSSTNTNKLTSQTTTYRIDGSLKYDYNQYFNPFVGAGLIHSNVADDKGSQTSTILATELYTGFTSQLYRTKAFSLSSYGEIELYNKQTKTISTNLTKTERTIFINTGINASF